MKRLLLIVVCFILSGCSSYPLIPDVTYNRNISNINQYRSVAVIGFTEPSDYRANGCSRIIEQYFEIYLSKVGFRVISRDQIYRILNEQKFQYSGLTNDQVVKLGQILGVRAIVTGSIIEWKQTLSFFDSPERQNHVIFTTKMIDVETGSILFSSISKLKKGVHQPYENITGFLVAHTVDRLTGALK